MAEESEETFKVTDRRGPAREEADAPEVAEHRPTAAGGSAESRRPTVPSDPAESRRPTVGAAPVEPDPETSAAPRQLDLQGIFVMFATSALMGLGEAADPVTRERRLDLEQAREAIDVLLLLRDKTSGNRTEQEDQLLEELVYDLQMRFVRVTNAQRSR